MVRLDLIMRRSFISSSVASSSILQSSYAPLPQKGAVHERVVFTWRFCVFSHKKLYICNTTLLSGFEYCNKYSLFVKQNPLILCWTLFKNYETLNILFFYKTFIRTTIYRSKDWPIPSSPFLVANSLKQVNQMNLGHEQRLKENAQKVLFISNAVQS